MRRRFLFALELIIIVVLVVITRCANYRDVFANGQIYFVDADCYARMTRARMCFEHPGTIIRHHDFENFPVGSSPHTTAPFDYLIGALAKLLAPITRNALDLAGAIVSPLLALATGIFLCWWSRRMQIRFRFALLGLFIVSPILVHGTALGRPDHQSLLMGLIAVALCAEWTAMWREIPSCAEGKLQTCPTFARRWEIVSGIAWALAIWVSFYEPLILLALVIMTSVLIRRTRWPRTKWIGFAAIGVIAILSERRFPAWPARQSFQSLKDWSGNIGELSHVPLFSHVWFEWCSWLILLTPILFWARGKPPKDSESFREQASGRNNAPVFLIVLLVAAFALTMFQARWGYFLALIFALLTPEISSVFRKPGVATTLFVIALFPVAQAWDERFSERALMTRTEDQIEQTELRSIAHEIDGPLLAPWWFSPALAYWSGQSAVAGSSHESISGITDSALFYAAAEPARAAEICRQHRVKWVVSYDSDRVAENSSRILGHSLAPNALCYVLDRHPSVAPPFLKLVSQTARFKLYRVERL